MESLNNLTGVKKIAAVFICILAALSIYVFAGTQLPKLGIGNIYPLFIAEVLLTAMAVLIAAAFKKLHVLRFTTRGLGIGLLCGIVPLLQALYGIFCYLVVGATVTVSSLEVIALPVMALLVGIAEEMFFRGILFNCLSDHFGSDTYKKVFKAVAISALLFGCAHISNLIKGAALGGTLVQMINAACTGFLFAAIYIRSKKNLWPCIILHAIYDLSGFLNGGMLAGVTSSNQVSSFNALGLIASAVYLLIGLFLLRKKKVEPLLPELAE